MSEATSTADTDPLEAGRAALARHDWPEAFEQLSLADREGQLSGADLESLSLAAFFAARADVELDVKERAFKAYQAEGNDLRAAYLALDVARSYGFQGKHSIASAWTGRAERIIGPEARHMPTGTSRLAGARSPRRPATSTRRLPSPNCAVEIGTRAADADLKASALTKLGSLKIAPGRRSTGSR